MSGPNPSQTMDALQWPSENLKPTLGVVAASENLTIIAGTGYNAYTDVPGVSFEITPAVESKILLLGLFNFANNGLSGNRTFEGSIKIDAEAELASPVSVVMAGATSQNFPATGIWLPTLTAAKHTIKMRVKANTETVVVTAANTKLAYLLFAN